LYFSLCKTGRRINIRHRSLIWNQLMNKNMNFHRTTFAALLGFSMLVISAKADVAEQEQAILEKYQDEFQQLSKDGFKGELKESNQRLMEILRKDPSTAMDVVIANMLYKVDRETSYALHKKAYQAEPDDRATILEWAMEQQRKGEYADAASLYQKYLKIVPQDVTKQALLADCLVRTGKLREAVQAWNSADLRKYHNAIDFDICEIYGPVSPVRRREDLLAVIRGGDNSVFEKLIYLDINFDRDWWNSEVNYSTLKLDLKFAATKLGQETQRYKDLEIYGKLAATEEVNAQTLKDNLTKAGLIIGEKSRLPGSSLIAQELVEKVIRCELETREQLLKKYEKELLSRAKSNPGDPDALRLLCFLYPDDDQTKLVEYGKLGWERFGDAKFAWKYLAGIAIEHKLKPDSAELKKALQQFPEDIEIRMLQVQIVGPDNITAEMIASVIKANYRQLGQLTLGYSYILNGGFELLNRQLEKK
jgi:tetratricopeptide (TPR) repeat protein